VSGAALTAEIVRATEALSPETAIALADAWGSVVLACGAGDEADKARRLVRDLVTLPEPRRVALRLLEVWQADASPRPLAALALALRTAVALGEARAGPSVELVWTGPYPPRRKMRGTEQVMLDLIDGARSTLDVATFAAYRVPSVTRSLERAAARGVVVTLFLEPRVGQPMLDTLAPVMRAGAVLYGWSADRRRDRGATLSGVLHAKCLVADGTSLFVSSANLTDAALTVNVEIGLLVRGGPTPAEVHDQLHRLVGLGIFTELSIA
jgi:phosphatidylserine/phosphatidylglycerophosphate/cardiolipin synthase-like enzyme